MVIELQDTINGSFRTNTTFGRNIAVAVSVAILSTIGVLLYLLVLPAMITYYRLSKQTFYLLMITLAIPETAWLFLTLVYSIPTILYESTFYGYVMERIMGDFDTVIYFVQSTNLFFVSVNRLRFVGRTSVETFDKVFTAKKVFFWTGILWAFSLGELFEYIHFLLF